MFLTFLSIQDLFHIFIFLGKILKCSCLRFFIYKKEILARHWWLTPKILATLEAEIRRTEVWSQPWANSSPDPIKKTEHVRSAGSAYLRNMRP
jgi:hypothetical protein